MSSNQQHKKQSAKNKADRAQIKDNQSKSTPETAYTTSPEALQRAIANPPAAPPDDILALQRAYGNRAVTRLVTRSPSSPPAPSPNRARPIRSEVAPSSEQHARGSNPTFPLEIRAKMERAFDADFSNVKLHPNSPKADKLGVLAVTQGHDIHFSPGKLQLQSQRGQALLGHELTHVVQQRQGRVRITGQAKGHPTNEDTALEREADTLGRLAAKGQRVPLGNAPTLTNTPFLPPMQFAKVLVTSSHDVYEPDKDDPDKVRIRSILGKKSTGTVSHYTLLDIADTPATNLSLYYKITAGLPGHIGDYFVKKPGTHETVTDIAATTKVAKQETNLKSGTRETPIAAGDIVEVSAETPGYYVAESRRHSTVGKGTLNKTKVTEHSGALASVGNNQETWLATQKTTQFLSHGASSRDKTVGVSNDKQNPELSPGDKLQVDPNASGMNASGAQTFLYAGHSNHYIPATTVRKTKAEEDKTPPTPTEQAATNTEKVSLYKPKSNDRTVSVGVDGELKKINLSGYQLAVDFAAKGLGPQGQPLVYAKDNSQEGYVEESLTRSVGTSRGHVEAYAQNIAKKSAQTLTPGQKFIVQTKTHLYQFRATSATDMPMKSVYSLGPGEILEATGNSLSTLVEDKVWYTELVTENNVNGLIQQEKVREADDFRLNLDAAPTLQEARVKATAHFRALRSENRKRHVGIGDKTVGFKADDIIKVDFNLRGVDENFSFEWVYAENLSGTQKGYIRAEKVTHPELEGQIATAQGLQGNKLDPNAVYIAKEDTHLKDNAGNTNIGDVSMGDRLQPSAAGAIARSAYYHGIENKRTNDTGRINISKVTEATEALKKGTPSDLKTGIVTEKSTHLYQPDVKHARPNNIGVSNTPLAEFTGGDKLKVDFGASGISKDAEVDWLYAETLNGSQKGYVKAHKVRPESGGRLVEVEAQQTQTTEVEARTALQGEFLPAYVTHKTKLRDSENKAQEAMDPGDMVEVNFFVNPPAQVTPPSANAPVANPHYKPDAERQKWVKVKLDTTPDDRYIREYKVTAARRGFEEESPEFKTSQETLNAVNLLFSEAQQPFKIASAVAKSESAEQGGSESEQTLAKAPYDAVSWSIGSVMGLVSMVQGFKNFKSAQQKALHLLGMADTAATMTANIFKAIDTAYKAKTGYAEGITTSGFMSDLVAKWADGIANTITAIKEAVLMVYNAIKKHGTKSTQKTGTVLQLAKGALSVVLAGVKAAKSFTDIFTSSGVGALTTAIPAIGIALNSAKALIGFRKWWISRKQEQEAIKEQGGEGGLLSERAEFEHNPLIDKIKQRFGNEINKDRPEEDNFNKLFVREYRGVRSASTLYQKTKYYRVNPKILFAIRNKEKLDVVQTDNSITRSKYFISSDYYVKEGSNSVFVKLDNKDVEVTPDAVKDIKQYEFVSKVEEVAKKKKTLGGEEVRSAIVNIVGEALTLGGPTALAGTIMKGTMAAIDTGFAFARFIGRQWANRQGQKIDTALKYTGEVTGINHSQQKKHEEYVGHARYIMEMIDNLATPEQVLKARGSPQEVANLKGQYTRVHKYLEMTGVDMGLLYAYNGKPAKQFGMIIDALKER